jgi:hypothetical protein
MTEPTIEGLPQLRSRLEGMTDAGGRRILKAALRAALNEIAKEMRRELPPKVKEGRRAIRGLVKGTRRVTAKVGVHVGRGRNNQPASRKPPTGGGVGIGAQNIHWWISGTKQRAQSTTSKPTGRMPALARGLARRAERIANPAARRAALTRARKQFGKEVAKQLARS